MSTWSRAALVFNNRLFRDQFKAGEVFAELYFWQFFEIILRKTKFIQNSKQRPDSLVSNIYLAFSHDQSANFSDSIIKFDKNNNNNNNLKIHSAQISIWM